VVETLTTELNYKPADPLKKKRVKPSKLLAS
jgi:hypothetical protein